MGNGMKCLVAVSHNASHLIKKAILEIASITTFNSDEAAFGSEPCVPFNQKSGTRNSFDYRFKVGMRRLERPTPTSRT